MRLCSVVRFTGTKKEEQVEVKERKHDAVQADAANGNNENENNHNHFANSQQQPHLTPVCCPAPEDGVCVWVWC